MRLGQSQAGLAYYPLIVQPPSPPPPVTPGPFVSVDMASPYDTRRARRPYFDQNGRWSGLTGITPPIQAIKWNPGHYADYDTIVRSTNTVNNIKSEINLINNLDNVLGYLIAITWAAIEQTLGVYNWTILDGIINYLTNRAGNNFFNKPKRYAIVIIPGSVTGSHWNAGDYSTVPQYIRNTPAYGQAGYRVGGVTTLPPGDYGWWGGDGNGNTACVAVWRPLLAERWCQLHEALGAHLDSDPMYEALEHAEDSWMIGAGIDNGDGTYSDDNFIPLCKQWMERAVAAHPTTNVMFNNTYLVNQAKTQALTEWMFTTNTLSHPINIGVTDTLGLTKGISGSWGISPYLGIVPPYPDRRAQRLCMCEIEGPDVGFFKNTGGWRREDILNALNQREQATHAFWVIIPSSIAPVRTVGNLSPVIPITWTSGRPNGATSGTLTSPWTLVSGPYTIAFPLSGNRGGTFTKGSANVTWPSPLTSAESTTGSTLTEGPLTPGNWWNGADGLGQWLNDPANALTNTGYPPDYP